jgi:hypothetical protein
MGGCCCAETPGVRCTGPGAGILHSGAGHWARPGNNPGKEEEQRAFKKARGRLLFAALRHCVGVGRWANNNNPLQVLLSKHPIPADLFITDPACSIAGRD